MEDEERTVSEEEARRTAGIVGLAALKYGDLSNQAVKDYVFDIERFTALNGMECCECGCCTYVCPAKRPLTQAFKEMRKVVAASRKKA